MRRKIMTISLIICILLLCPFTAFAQELSFDRKGSVSVTLTDSEQNAPIAGAELAVYSVAAIESDGHGSWKYSYADAFENAGIYFEDPAITIELEKFVEENDVPSRKGVTDANGKAVFSDLPMGLYFVKQVGTVEGYAPCKSFLVTIPLKNEQGYVYNVDASPKTEVTKLTSITIEKVWNTGKSTEISDSVTVHLCCDGEVVETATLNEENAWKVTYEDMPVSDAYSVKEINVPKGFTATYSQNEYRFTITNTASLAQTGQLMWPIPILAAAGVFFLLAGMIILYKTRNRNA